MLLSITWAVQHMYKILSTNAFLKDIMKNCKSVATALNNAGLNLIGAIDKVQREKVVMDYFLEDDYAMLTLSD